MSRGWLLLTLRSCQIVREAKNDLNGIVKAIRPNAAENVGTPFWSGLCQDFTVQCPHTLARITIFEDRIEGIRNLIGFPFLPLFHRPVHQLPCHGWYYPSHLSAPTYRLR